MKLDTGFRPSSHGYGFPNMWKDTLLGVVTSRGRCGGMVFGALDHFTAGVALPPDARMRTLPAYDSALALHIWRRQVDSVVAGGGTNMVRFVALTYLPTSVRHGVALVTRQELLPLFDLLRSGRPAPLGLVSAVGLTQLARNHQVLAYAATFGSEVVRISVYDPNHPLRDDVVIDVPLEVAQPVVERIGSRVKVWRGLFVEHYRPARVRHSVVV